MPASALSTNGFRIQRVRLISWHFAHHGRSIEAFVVRNLAARDGGIASAARIRASFR
jgi:hypothetical protein